MPYAHLLSPQQLSAWSDQPDLVILDCRFALEDPEYGQRCYLTGHLPGARFADLEKDLSGPVIPGKTGRHPLPEPVRLLNCLRHWGISQNSRVVLYDDGPGAFAARAWWLLLWLGKHSNLFLVDGGLAAWQRAGLPLTTAIPAPAPGNLAGSPDARLLLDARTLLEQLDTLTLLDARSLPRFYGEQEPIDPVAGHIPGARCAPFTDNLGPDGCFLPAARLQAHFSHLLQGADPEQVVAYCGSGVTACHNLFALCLAGYPLARLYAGSWSEWITDASRPVAARKAPEMN